MILGLLACAALPTMAHAVQSPMPGLLDPHIRTVRYDSNQVVQLRGYFGYQMMIEFAADEKIENVSIGEGTAWQVTPNHKANRLFLKPVDRAAPTNMTVVTDQRRYAFELLSRGAPGGHTADIAYVISFIYPQPPSVLTHAAAPAGPPDRRNTAYSYTGSRASLPSLVFDDGRFTYFQWPDTAATPAVFVVQPDGSESIINYGVRGGYQVVEQLAPRFVLRNGKDVTTVINNGWREPSPGALAPVPADARTARAAARPGRPAAKAQGRP